MILRKPYAFFIKMFKPIHIFLAIIVSYTIYLENTLYKFLNIYLSSTNAKFNDSVNYAISTSFLYVLPIIVMVASILILTVMFKKKKPVTFYFINIFLFLVVLIINLYSINFFNVIKESVVSIATVKMIHDLLLICILLESISLVFFLIRGIGINLKKFDFDSDISKIDISDKDKEEFELNINLNIDEVKRKRNKKLRYFKYFYYENKFLFNIVVLLSLIIISISIILGIKFTSNTSKEGVEKNIGSFSIEVNNTSILNKDYEGKVITNNYLIIVNASIKNNYLKEKLYLNDFSLNINEAVFKPVSEYEDSISDLGILYKSQKISYEYTKYLFVFEVPKNYINNKMIFKYSALNNNYKFKLKPNRVGFKNKNIESAILNGELNIKENLGNISFKILSYDLKDKYKLQYSYCANKDYCIDSYEYIKASFNENYDKYVLKLSLEYNSEYPNLDNFYNLLNKFGSIRYVINETEYIQDSGFENIVSNKANNKNDIYIGVNSNISEASEIEFIFNIRGNNYTYKLK